MEKEERMGKEGRDFQLRMMSVLMGTGSSQSPMQPPPDPSSCMLSSIASKHMQLYTTNHIYSFYFSTMDMTLKTGVKTDSHCFR